MQDHQDKTQPLAGTDQPNNSAARHPLDRQHVLQSERESENAVFSQERSPVELEIEKGIDRLSPGRSPGWTTRSL